MFGKTKKKDKSEYNVNIFWQGVALSHTFLFIPFNIVLLNLYVYGVQGHEEERCSLPNKKINNDLLLNVCYVEIQLQSVWYMSWWWGDLLRNGVRVWFWEMDLGQVVENVNEW